MQIEAEMMASSSLSSCNYLSKCVMRGGVVYQILYGHIRFDSSMDVIFGKETSIELLEIAKDGKLQSVWDQPVFGTIRDLAVLPCAPQMCGKDLLVAISDSGKLSLLKFCNEMNRFIPIKHVQLFNPGSTRVLQGRMLAVDSSGCFIAASAYEDQLALFSVSMSSIDIIAERIIYPSKSEGTESTSRNMQETSIRGTIWSMCFISLDSSQQSTGHNPVLAIILHRRGELLNELLLLEWNVKEQTIGVISQYGEDGPLAHNIVEVPNSQGLAFLFRAGDVLLMNFKNPRSPFCLHKTSLNFLSFVMEEQTHVGDHSIGDRRKRTKLNEKSGDYDLVCIDSDKGDTNSGHKYICSWSWKPDNNKHPRMIFCGNTGEFFMFDVFLDSDPKVVVSKRLYKGQPCKELLWVKGGYLAAIVEMGDGMVLKLKKGKLRLTNPILNIAPILDAACDEKHGQMFACCGVAPEGSIRIIQSGISVEKLHTSGPICDGVHISWTVRMRVTDSCHSFIVLSFLEWTGILSAGPKWYDVTASVGFKPDVLTLACGLVRDDMLVQIYKSTVRLCLPTADAHSEGIPLRSPICKSWSPDNLNISLGAVGHNFIVVSTSNPCFLFILGVSRKSTYECEIFEMQRLQQQSEISCISIPGRKKQSNSSISENDSFVIGTHRPSVEIWSFASDRHFTRVACGTISLTSAMETSERFCAPQDVRLVFAGKYYVVAGLRNGMLFRFEWPEDLSHSSPINVVDTASSSKSSVTSTTRAFDKRNDIPSVLRLVAVRCMGMAPIFLVPLDDTLDADIIALCDRPWLLHTARHGLSYTSISVQPSSHVTHLTPVCTADYPNGILFVVEGSLHLLEMVHNKRFSTKKFPLEGTPRKVLYHNESRKLLVMRTGLNKPTYSSDICCVDPLSGIVLSSFELEDYGEGRSMGFVKFESKQAIVVGASRFPGPDAKPSGEAENKSGFLLVLYLEKVRCSDVDTASKNFFSKPGPSYRKNLPFHESGPDDKNVKLLFRKACATHWNGIPRAICPYLDGYFLVSAGNAFSVCGLRYDTSVLAHGTGSVDVIKFAIEWTRFMIRSLTAHRSRIAVGDGRDGVIFFSYDKEAKKLEQLYADPSLRLVADCILMDDNTAVVSDREGSIAVLCSDHLEDADWAGSPSDRRSTTGYYVLIGAWRSKKQNTVVVSSAEAEYRAMATAAKELAWLENLLQHLKLGDIEDTKLLDDYDLLEAVQAKLVNHPLTEPVLGNAHNEFRSRENPVGVPKMLDGDMLTQLLELTSEQQDTILQSLPPQMLKPQVVQLLEKVHSTLN